MDPPKRTRVSDHTRGNARSLRRAATAPERILWQVLRNRQIAGLKFRRQHPIESFVVDFCCSEAAIVVEVDGRSHDGQGAYDAARQRRLEEIGVRVLRVSNDDVLGNLEGVLTMIASAASSGGAAPSPSPSP
ncbi:MAG: endonuclease domain-containing protein [Lacipirellulaceae bacterium]